MKNQRKYNFIYVFFPLILAGLLYGVYELFILRFREGDVYPPYSSLRTDPLGTKALYEGFADQKGLWVGRNFGPVDKLQQVQKTVIFDLGEYPEDVVDVPAEECKDLERFVLDGGRMVVSLVGDSRSQGQPSVEVMGGRFKVRPGTSPTETPTAVETTSPTPEQEKPSSRVGSLATPVPSPPVTLGKVWGVEVAFQELPKITEEGSLQNTITYQPVTILLEKSAPTDSTGTTLPPKLMWHSGYYFEGLDPAWKVLYRRGDHPVVIERPWGKGQLMFFSDSFLVSNEAMEAERQAGFLAYLPGEKRRVLFDETHLGVYEADNMATLMAQYGLRGLLLGFIILALLFIWRNMMSLAPPPPDESGVAAGGRSGKDFSSGLVNLLKRNIPAGDILSVCFGLWKKTFAKGHKHLAARVEEMEKEMQAMRSRRGNVTPAEGYQRLSRIFKKKIF